MTTSKIHQTEIFKRWLMSLNDPPTRICLARDVEIAIAQCPSFGSEGIIEFSSRGQHWWLLYKTNPGAEIILCKCGAAPMVERTEWCSISARDLTLMPFDVSTYLVSESDVVIYLEMLLENANAREIAMGIEQVKRARNMIRCDRKEVALLNAASKNNSDSADRLAKILRKVGFLLEPAQECESA